MSLGRYSKNKLYHIVDKYKSPQNLTYPYTFWFILRRAILTYYQKENAQYIRYDLDHLGIPTYEPLMTTYRIPTFELPNRKAIKEISPWHSFPSTISSLSSGSDILF